ncbi:MAG: AfsR/SARP family transcriptional regulator, partial [Chloroflexota bacterium]
MTAELRFNLLGAISISRDERPLTPFRSRTAEALLIYLAMHQKSFSRQVLADFFWDERPQKQALSNLRTVLALLRRRLDEYLIITHHTVAFNHRAPHWIDATTFRHRANPQSLISNLQSPVPNLQSLLTLYRGDFLSGFSLPESQGFQAWTLLIREELRQLAIATLQRLNEHFLAATQYHEGLPYAQRLLHMNPLDDLAQRQMMELLWRSGQRNGALKIYEEAKQLLAQELSVEPDAATTALYTRIRASSFPPPCTAPTPPTTFIGREEDLTKLTAMLADRQARLITILGAAGAGKTRLLIEAMRQAAETPGRFMDGLYFIPLADLSSPAFLPTTVAQHIGLTFHGQTDPDEQVLAALRACEMVLGLDNIEHLLTTRTRRWLARIVRDAPGVRLVVSSRARLGLQGEQLLPLAGLAVPPETASASPVNVADFPAVRHFCARAAAVNARFNPDASEMDAIARLCRLLTGMPLGLELAAAGAAHLSCAEIAAHVQERLDWQFDHFPDRPRRHQNLQAAFAHSWDLLSAANQVAARRLSLFAGPFNSAAAHAVARVLPAQLSTLSDHSLLSQDRPGRFTFHPLIRRFLAQKMEAHPGEAFETARRLVDYITHLPAIEGKGTNMESRYQELKQVMAQQREQVLAAALWLARRRDFSGRRLVTLLEALIFYFAHEGQMETWKVICRQLLRALAEG